MYYHHSLSSFTSSFTIVDCNSYYFSISNQLLSVAPVASNIITNYYKDGDLPQLFRKDKLKFSHISINVYPKISEHYFIFKNKERISFDITTSDGNKIQPKLTFIKLPTISTLADVREKFIPNIEEIMSHVILNEKQDDSKYKVDVLEGDSFVIIKLLISQQSKESLHPLVIELIKDWKQLKYNKKLNKHFENVYELFYEKSVPEMKIIPVKFVEASFVKLELMGMKEVKS